MGFCGKLRTPSHTCYHGEALGNVGVVVQHAGYCVAIQRNADELAPSPFQDCWYAPIGIPVPAEGLNVAYTIQSPSKNIHYYGSTGHMERRLRQHRTNQGAEQTKGISDWVLVA